MAADTTVDVDGAIVGKPADAAEAAATLRPLSGRAHLVHTGRGRGPGRRLVSSVTTSTVQLRSRSDHDAIDAYVATGEPLDKAGGYGLQGSRRRSSPPSTAAPATCVGLPMAQTEALLGAVGLRAGPLGPAAPDLIRRFGAAALGAVHARTETGHVTAGVEEPSAPAGEEGLGRAGAARWPRRLAGCACASGRVPEPTVAVVGDSITFLSAADIQRRADRRRLRSPRRRAHRSHRGRGRRRRDGVARNTARQWSLLELGTNDVTRSSDGAGSAADYEQLDVPLPAPSSPTAASSSRPSARIARRRPWTRPLGHQRLAARQGLTTSSSGTATSGPSAEHGRGPRRA